MKAEVVEKMGKQELHQNAKRLGIKYGKLSLMQIREALIASDDKVPTKPKQRDTSPRKGSKVEKCVELYKANSKATRQELIAIFIKSGGLTSPASASTYLYNIQQKYGKPK